MSIATEIQRITGNITDSYTAAQAKGATMPQVQNSDNLADTIATITGGGAVDEYANVITIENTIKGTNYVEQTEIATACDNISMFLYGTANS